MPKNKPPKKTPTKIPPIPSRIAKSAPYRDPHQAAKEIQRDLDRSLASMQQTAREMRQGLTYARGRQQQLQRIRNQDLLTVLLDNPITNNLQRQFFTALFPIPGAIQNVLLAFHDTLTDAQKAELGDIGKTFAALPFELLTGQISPEEFYEKTVETLDRLKDFFIDLAQSYIDNPENLINIADIALKSCGPLGEFFSTALKEVVKAGLEDDHRQPLERAIRGTERAFGGLIDTLKKIVSNTLGFDPGSFDPSSHSRPNTRGG